MRKLFGLVLIVFVLIGLGYLFRQKVNRDLSQKIVIPSVIPAVTSFVKKTSVKSVSTSIFVPYWTMGEEIADIEEYDQVIYFGISPDENGINLSDEDRRLLDKFIASTDAGKSRSLTVRMISNDLNTKILEDKVLQDKIIEESIGIAQEYGFDGMVLDLELSAIPFDSLVKRISNFITKFYKAGKKADVKFSLAVYGDVFYRARPFDIQALSGVTDEVMIMAYDFHKARGNPGPNFPLSGADKYGYDFEELTADFLEIVPPEKLTVIFGMYGYDWTIDESGKSQGEAEALSYNEIRQKFLDGCEFDKCERGRDGESGEAFVKYVDGEGERHVVWYEDLESVERKKEFLLERGISSFSYWAYSYF